MVRLLTRKSFLFVGSIALVLIALAAFGFFYLAPGNCDSQALAAMRTLVSKVTEYLGIGGTAPTPSTSSRMLGTTQGYAFVASAGSSGGAGARQTFPAPLDDSSLAVISVVSSAPLSFTLIDPHGCVITPSIAASDTHLTYVTTSPGGGQVTWNYQYQIRPSIIGTWQSVIQTSAQTAFNIWSVVDSPKALGVIADNGQYTPGSVGTVQAALLNNTSVIASNSVTGTLSWYGQTPLPLTFYDNGTHGDRISGDNIYSAQFTAPKIEAYGTITVTGTQGATTRTGDTIVSFVSQTTQFDSVASIITPDTNNNGLYEALNFELFFTTADDVQLDIHGTLVDSSGQTVATASYSTRSSGKDALDHGTHALVLSFDGRAIHDSGKNGPYTLTNLFVDDTTNITANQVSATNVATTSAYQANQFEGQNK